MKTLAAAIPPLAALCCAAGICFVCSARAAADELPEICSFIAQAYNRGDAGKLWGYPDPVDIAGDGKLRHVYIVEQGTAHATSIIASTRPLSPAEQETADASEVNFYGSIGQDMSLDTVAHIFRFKDGYYVVYEEDGGPDDVIKPNVGELCRFGRHYAAVLTENRAPALCEDARAGKTFDNLPTRELASAITVDDAATLDLPGPFSPTIARYAKLKLDPAAPPVTVGYFTYQSSAGAGCDAAGIVFLQGQDIETSPRNTALLAAERDMTDCRGSNAFLVTAGGRSLIEIDGGAAAQRTAPPRLLLRLRDDRIETVCRVDQTATFSPQAAKR